MPAPDVSAVSVLHLQLTTDTGEAKPTPAATSPAAPSTSVPAKNPTLPTTPTATSATTAPPADTNNQQDGAQQTTGVGAGWLVLIACIALSGVLITAFVQWKLGQRTGKAAQDNASAVGQSAEAAKVSAAAAGRSAKAAEDAVALNLETSRATAKRANDEALAKRYQDAASQLGHENPAVRLAGVYSMARLADDWKEQRVTCIEVLCGYLRISAAKGNTTTSLAEEQV